MNQKDAFLAYLRAIGCVPKAGRRGISDRDLRRFMNWSAIIFARYTECGKDVQQRKELWAKMENFLPAYINSGRKP